MLNDLHLAGVHELTVPHSQLRQLSNMAACLLYLKVLSAAVRLCWAWGTLDSFPPTNNHCYADTVAWLRAKPEHLITGQHGSRGL